MSRLSLVWCGFAVCLTGCSPALKPVAAVQHDTPPRWSDVCFHSKLAINEYERTAENNTMPFVRMQKFVAYEGCQDSSQFDDPAWFVDTLDEFIRLFLEQDASWQKVISGCPWKGEVLCVAGMVNRHIYGDLIKALQVSGCGTEHDWNTVDTFLKRAAALEGSLWSLGADYLVPLQRSEVRLNCLRGVFELRDFK